LRVLVTGGGGLLGGRLAGLLHHRGFEVAAAHRSSLPPPGPRPVLVELTDEAALARLLDALRPDAVVHAAVLGRADECEARPEAAERVNARLPGTVARLCRERACRLVALSTDLVFGGDRAAVSEQDSPRPLSVYGRTKLAGEEAVLRELPSAAIARVALVLGRGHGSRLTSTESVWRALREGRPLRLFTDEYRTPVDPESVADAVSRLLVRGGGGRFHLGGPERLSRHELGLRVARAFGLPESAVTPGRQADHAGPDARAADVSLASTRARRELGWEPRPIDEAIREGRTDQD
jgi:dTDP-4-dehydrorhamnose reductase